MFDLTNPRRTTKPGEPTSFFGVLARDAFGIIVWLVGAFVVATVVAFVLCLLYGLPLLLAPIGGVVAAVAIAGLVIAFKSTTIFDIFG